VQQKLGLLGQQTSSSIAMEFSLRTANISPNRNVAHHARSVGPPWHSALKGPYSIHAAHGISLVIVVA